MTADKWFARKGHIRPAIYKSLWRHPLPLVGRPARGTYSLVRRGIQRGSSPIPHPSQWAKTVPKHMKSQKALIYAGRGLALAGTTTPGMDIPTLGFYRRLPKKSLLKFGMKGALRLAGPIGAAMWIYTGYEAAKYLRDR